jgi:AraC family transcriptional regulator
VLDFVEEHLEHEIGVSDLAEVACLSPFYFSRAFKHATGYSPYKFLLHRRVEHAKSLLLRPELSIADVARRCQFSSSSGFATAFASAVGVSPRRYRQERRVSSF